MTRGPVPAKAQPSGCALLSGWLIGLLLVWPWIHPWAPGPLPNTLPLLVSWGALAALLALGHLPSAMDLAKAWVCAALISSAMGLVQYFGAAAPLGGWVHVPGTLGEAMANLRQRNQLATLTSMGAVAVLWWRSQGLPRRHTFWMLTLLAFGNAASNSRTGLLQWLLLAGLLALWQWTARGRRPPWSWPWLLWGLGMYLLGSVLLPWALAIGRGQGISNALVRMTANDGCGSRSVLWHNVLQLIGERPWTGWGWGELKYAHYMASYPGERFCDILGHAHNLPLHLAVTLGIPATALLGLVCFWLVWRARPWRPDHPSASLAWGVLAVVGLHSLLEFPLWYGPFQLAVLGSVLILWRPARPHLASHHRHVQLLGVAGLCLVTLIAWDYQQVRQMYLPAAQRSTLWSNDPWPAARQTWFFTGTARFAELTTTPVTADNAHDMLDASLSVLHYSPEPRVIDKLIASAHLTGQDALANWHQAQKQKVYGPTAD